MNGNEDPLDVGSFLGAYVGFIVVVWIISAVVASGIAPLKRQLEFFLLTVFFLGPLGVGFAAVAPDRYVQGVAGRLRYMCPRCGAPQYVDADKDKFECWQCDETAEIVSQRFGRTSIQPVPKVTPKGRRRFLCVRCGVKQNIREDDTSYDCWQCGEHYSIPPKKKPVTAKK
ncbi:hypothetical protein ABGB19_23455 [Mycobacterium sp. B14F4]